MDDKRQSKDISSDETFDFICSNCDANGKIAEAVRYCLQCKGYCCQTCIDQHVKSLVMKDHKLLGAGQGNKASNQPAKLPEFPTERCYLHEEEVVDKFCEEHNEVCCCECIDILHTSCPKKGILSIPDMINKLFKRGDCKHMQNRLRDMINYFGTIGKSKDDKLEALKDMKKEEIKKIIDCQKALESFIKKAGESSIGEIENVCNDLEKDILDEKRDIKRTEDSMKESEDKLVKVEGNRAEHFVWSKIVEKKILEAAGQMSKHKNDGLLLAFTPNQSLVKHLHGLNSIGRIDVKTNIRTDLYKMIKNNDIPLQMPNDLYACGSDGCCLTLDNELLVTDYNNKKLKLIDTQTMTIVESCELDSAPQGVCITNDHEAAIACSKRIQFVSIHGKKMTTTRQIKTPHKCYGIIAKDDKLYVTNGQFSLYIYTISGKLLKTISHDIAGNKLFTCSRHVTFSKNGDKMYVCDWHKGIVCLDSEGKYLFTINDSELKGAGGVCVDGKGNVFVSGDYSHNVVQFDENGMKIGVVIQNGLDRPTSDVCFDQELNRLFVTISFGNPVKMFELI